jgi:hypothetical protein
LEEKRVIARELAELLIHEIPPPITIPEKDGDWTKNVRRKLRAAVSGEEFLSLQWKCFPENPESTKGEFLVDFLWWRAREGAVLVVESEWSREPAEYSTISISSV